MWRRMHPALWGWAVLACACGTGDLKRVPEQVEVQPSTLSFGDVFVGGSSIQSALVMNRGASRVQVEIGDLPAGFSVEPRRGSIPPGGGLAIEVKFAPEEIGLSSGGIRFLSQSLDGEIAVQVEGKGVRSAFDVADVLDFDDVFLGKSKTLVLPIQSQTDVAVQVEVSMEGDSGFSIGHQRIDLSPRGIEALEVSFMPTEVAPALGLLELAACAGCPRTQVPLRARGIDWRLVATPGSLDFGAVPLGLVASRAISVTNEGKGPIFLADAIFASTKEGTFAIESFDFSEPLEAGGVGRIEVTFSPDEAGPHEASIRLHDADGMELLEIPVEGRGGGPLLQVSPSRIDLGIQPQGRELKRTVRIENVGEGGSALLQAIVIVGSGADAFSLDLLALPEDVGLAPLEMEFLVRGDRAQEWQAEIVFHTDLAAQPTLQLPLSMTTAAPIKCDLQADRNQVRFGRVENSYVGSRSLELTNQAAGSCLLWGIRIEGDSSRYFKLETERAEPFFLLPGEVLSLPIRFEAASAPTDVLLNADLLIEHGIVDTPPLIVPLSGLRKRWDWNVRPIPPVFEATPVDRATVATVAMVDACGRGIHELRISDDSSPAFRFPSSQPYSIRCDSDSIKIAFVPHTQGRHRGQLELVERFGNNWLPFLIDLEAVAVGPCDDCEWPSPFCLPETTVVVNEEVPFSDGWPFECNWGFTDPEWPRGGGMSLTLRQSISRPTGSSPTTCIGTFLPYMVGDYTLGNLRVRPDGRAAYCESTIHAAPRNGLWVEAIFSDFPDFSLDLRALSGEGGEPGLRSSWFEKPFACPNYATLTSISCPWGQPGSEDDAVLLGRTWGPPSQRLHVERPSDAHPYHLGAFASDGDSPLSVDFRIFCDGALVAQPSIKFPRSASDFIVAGSIQFSPQGGCAFTPDGVTSWPDWIAPDL